MIIDKRFVEEGILLTIELNESETPIKISLNEENTLTLKPSELNEIFKIKWDSELNINNYDYVDSEIRKELHLIKNRINFYGGVSEYLEELSLSLRTLKMR